MPLIHWNKIKNYLTCVPVRTGEYKNGSSGNGLIDWKNTDLT